MANENESTVSRRKEILRLLNENGRVFVEELSNTFSVSKVTIRKDLDQLEQKNVLIKARGGALKIDTLVPDQRVTDKIKLNFEEKARIGKKAAELIRESENILIDSGSTTSELVRNLPDFQDLTIITNAFTIANQLLSKPNINMIVPGGYFRKNSQSLVGPLAEKSLRNFHVDKVFLGVDGFDTRLGIFTPIPEEARLNEVMIEISKEVIVLADSTKFNKKSFAFICPLESIHKVVTDSKIHTDDKQRLQDAGIEVIIA
ncbi:MAG: DeoR family transcriptional regulator [Sphingobacteriales bacterium 50-39]|nr:DeoR/GlpR transcriptional regulator [Sphingobacteriales bacterium]OJW55898.1 MAG: DeoR family transcriptional regulator [Sphingobacteriales bacterium 50-39]